MPTGQQGAGPIHLLALARLAPLFLTSFSCYSPLFDTSSWMPRPEVAGEFRKGCGWGSTRFQGIWCGAGVPELGLSNSKSKPCTLAAFCFQTEQGRVA